MRKVLLLMLLFVLSINAQANTCNVNGLKYLTTYIVENIICYLAVIWIMSKIYLKGAIGATINSKKNTKKDNSELTLKDFKKKNKYRTYILNSSFLFCRYRAQSKE